MMKKIGLFLMIMSVIIIVGCGSTSSSRQPEENYRTGSQGISLSFMQNMPPSKVYDDEALPILLEIHNRGATDVTGGMGRVYLSGFDDSIITDISTIGEPIEGLEGRGFYNPEGDEDILEFEGNVRDLESRNIDKVQATILATVCYPYQTIANPTVCIDPDPYSLSAEEKVCDFNSVSMSSTQGAPVAVTRVDAEAAKGKTKFKIYISNVGGGMVIKDGLGYLDKCNPHHSENLAFDEINQVALTDVVIGDVSIKGSCKPLNNDFIRLKSGGETYIICTLDGLTGSAYTTPLRVVLDYGYRSSISRSLEIVQTP